MFASSGPAEDVPPPHQPYYPTAPIIPLPPGGMERHSPTRGHAQPPEGLPVSTPPPPVSAAPPVLTPLPPAPVAPPAPQEHPPVPRQAVSSRPVLPWPVYFPRPETWLEFSTFKALESRCRGAYKKRLRKAGRMEEAQAVLQVEVEDPPLASAGRRPRRLPTPRIVADPQQFAHPFHGEAPPPPAVRSTPGPTQRAAPPSTPQTVIAGLWAQTGEVGETSVRVPVGVAAPP